VIFDELCHGITRPSSRNELIAIAGNLISQGAEGIVLGCTELPFILVEKDIPAPLFDSTEIHALAAVEFALVGRGAL